MRTLISVALVVAGASEARAHGPSTAFADWSIAGRAAELRITLQAHDVVAGPAGIDRDEDSQITAAELEAARPIIAERVLAGTRLSASSSSPERKADCSAAAPRVSGLDDPVVEVHVAIDYSCRGRISWVEIGQDYGGLLAEPHSTAATITGPERTLQHRFGEAQPLLQARVAPPEPGARWWPAAAAALLMVAGALVAWWRRKLG